MVLFNYSTKELTAKIVYYGPGLCGKTTNLQFIFDSLPDEKKGRMLSLSTQTDRTLYFDFLPVELGNIRGMKTRMQLYTVPGQVFYNETRKMVLKGVDGVVFVADSQSQVAAANLESFKNLEENLREHGCDLAVIPLVLQYNKRDLPSIQPVEEMNAALNRYNAPFYEAIATTGIGVHDTLKAISKLVLLSLSGDKDAARNASAPAPTPVQPVVAAPPPAPPTAAISTETAHRAWDTDGLDEMLEQMDADEIQGLLEEVDEFGEPNATPAEAPRPALETGTDAGAAATTASPAWTQHGSEPPPAPEEETSFAELGTDLSADPDRHAVWLGDEEQDQDGAIPEIRLDSEPTTSHEDLLAGAFRTHGEDRRPSPEEAAKDENLFSASPALEPADDTKPGLDEESLSFESFLAEERGQRTGGGTPATGKHAGEWPADSQEVEEEVWPEAPAQAQAGEEPAAEDDEALALDHTDLAPRLAPGTPVVNGNGTVKVPLRVQVGPRTYAYTLTVSLDAEEGADPDALA